MSGQLDRVRQLSGRQIMPRTPRYWSPEEDQVLRNEVISYCMLITPIIITQTDIDGTRIVNEGTMVDWCQISEKLSDRTNKDCRKRWHNAVAGGLNKGQWTKEEDDLLRSGVTKFGQRYATLLSLFRRVFIEGKLLG